MLISLSLTGLLAGCTVHGMEDQPKIMPLQASDIFPDGRSARPLVDGTVARGELRTDTWLYEGKVNGHYVNAFPFPITPQILQRGQERYNIYCAVCHDRAGTGHGMIVQRGFTQPPSYHTDRLRNAPVGHFFDVMTQGYGAMYSYNDRVSVEDRWAIAAYIRALQLSQHATLADVPKDQRETITAGNQKGGKP